MKKQIFNPYKLALAFILLSANTMVFAQERDQKREHGKPENRPATPQGQPAQRVPETRPAPAPADHQPRVMPGRPSERSRVPEQLPQTRVPDRQPVTQRPTQEPRVTQVPRNYQRPATPPYNRAPVVQQPVQRPNVNNNTQADRWNRGARPTPENRVTVNNGRRDNNNNYNRSNNYNRTYTNGRYNGNFYRPRPQYNRPPVVWQGRRYYTNYSYAYHPYRPYYYGSFYHPFGYFVGSLAASAMLFSWNNMYYGYDQGIYYEPYNNGYRVVPAPIGAYIGRLPAGFTSVNVDGYVYYYFAGTFYVSGSNGYEIVPAPPGAIVYDLPEGAKEVRINDTVYIEFNGTYYQPIVIDGRDAYEVVDTEEDDNF